MRFWDSPCGSIGVYWEFPQVDRSVLLLLGVTVTLPAVSYSVLVEPMSPGLAS